MRVSTLNSILFSLFMAFAIVQPASAQKARMAVSSFSEDMMDQTANTHPNIVWDQNGEKCALIKISTTQKGFMFDVGSLGVMKVEEQNDSHPAEIWVYVPEGAMKLSIQHKQLGSISDYDMGRRLQKAKTYRLELTSDDVSTLVIDYDNNRYMRLKLVPPTASIKINGMDQRVDADGICEITMPFGNHTYRATAADYHTLDGQLSVSASTPETVVISLAPAFGYLTVRGNRDMEGATVFVDGMSVGKVPLTDYPVASGDHKLTVRKRLYTPFSDNFSVTDTAHVYIIPRSFPNYETVELVCEDPQAEIYLNGEYLGTGSWKGPIEIGSGTIETQRTNYTPASITVDVMKGDRRRITVPAPTPIYGTLDLQTTPSGADVYLNGKYMGTTPFANAMLLVGDYHVDLKKKGCRSESLDLIVSENSVTRRSVRLVDYCTATVYSEPSYSSVYINGRYVGSTPYTLNLTGGEYDVRVAQNGYTTFNKTMQLNGTTDDFTVRLHKVLVKRNEFYLQAGYNILGMNSLSMGAGFFYHDFNMEGNYNMTLGEEDGLKPWSWNVRMGWGIRIGTRVRLTPQVGATFVNTDEIGNEKGKAIAVTGGLRLNFAIASWFGISVTPEYSYGVSRNDTYEWLEKADNKYKNYVDGIGLNASINIFF